MQIGIDLKRIIMLFNLKGCWFMKLKESSFITSIALLPFIFLLSILMLQGVPKGGLYSYLLVLMIIIFTITFIFSLFFAVEEIRNSDDKKRIVFLILFPFIYLPIYYTKYIYKNERYLGYGISLANIMLIVSFYVVVKGFVYDYTAELNHKNIKARENYVYVDKNNLFSINVNNNYTCNKDLGDYVIACENKDDDSFLGVYSYKKKSFSKGTLDDIKSYHIEQTVNYIKENEKIDDIEEINDLTIISYSNMKVIIKQVLYTNDNDSYCLVIIKEINKDNFDIINFEKTIQDIVFLV